MRRLVRRPQAFHPARLSFLHLWLIQCQLRPVSGHRGCSEACTIGRNATLDTHLCCTLLCAGARLGTVPPALSQAVVGAGSPAGGPGVWPCSSPFPAMGRSQEQGSGSQLAGRAETACVNRMMERQERSLQCGKGKGQQFLFGNYLASAGLWLCRVSEKLCVSSSWVLGKAGAADSNNRQQFCNTERLQSPRPWRFSGLRCKAMSNPVWIQCWPCFEQELSVEIFRDPSQTKWFCDCVTEDGLGTAILPSQSVESIFCFWQCWAQNLFHQRRSSI